MSRLANQVRLGGSLQTNHAEALAVVRRVGNALHHLGDDCLGLRLVHDPFTGARSVSIPHVPGHYRREPSGAILPQGDQRLRLITKGVRELNDFGHAAEMLAQANPARKTDLSLIEEAVVNA